MKRLAPGFYVTREPGGSVLHVFRYAGHWHYMRQHKEFPPEKVATLYMNLPYHRPNYATMKMAISASHGGRSW